MVSKAASVMFVLLSLAASLAGALSYGHDRYRAFTTARGETVSFVFYLQVSMRGTVLFIGGLASFLYQYLLWTFAWPSRTSSASGRCSAAPRPLLCVILSTSYWRVRSPTATSS